jgi:hypothetical protein
VSDERARAHAAAAGGTSKSVNEKAAAASRPAAMGQPAAGRWLGFTAANKWRPHSYSLMTHCSAHSQQRRTHNAGRRLALHFTRPTADRSICGGLRAGAYTAASGYPDACARPAVPCTPPTLAAPCIMLRGAKCLCDRRCPGYMYHHVRRRRQQPCQRRAGASVGR